MKKTLYYSFYSVSGWQKPITLTWSLAAVSKSFAIVGRDRLFFNKDFAACKTEIGNSILPNTLNYRLIRPLTLSLLPQLISGCIGYSKLPLISLPLEGMVRKLRFPFLSKM